MYISYRIHLVFLLYMCLWLTTWDWITYLGLILGKKIILSLNSHYFPVALHLEVRTDGISPSTLPCQPVLSLHRY